MSAECHALMMQAFNIAKENVDEMVAAAKAGEDGFTMTDGKLFKDGKRVAVSEMLMTRWWTAFITPPT